MNAEDWNRMQMANLKNSDAQTVTELPKWEEKT